MPEAPAQQAKGRPCLEARPARLWLDMLPEDQPMLAMAPSFTSAVTLSMSSVCHWL